MTDTTAYRRRQRRPQSRPSPSLLLLLLLLFLLLLSSFFPWPDSPVRVYMRCGVSVRTAEVLMTEHWIGR